MPVPDVPPNTTGHGGATARSPGSNREHSEERTERDSGGESRNWPIFPSRSDTHTHTRLGEGKFLLRPQSLVAFKSVFGTNVER